VRLPIRLRMALWYAALLAAAILALSVYLVLRLRADVVGDVDRNLVPAAGQIAHDYRQEGIPEFADSAGTVLHGERAAGQLAGAHGAILTTFGDPVSRRPMLVPGDVAQVVAGATIARTRRLDRDAAPFRVVARPVTRRRQREAVVVAQSLAPMQASTHRVVVLLALDRKSVV